MRAPEVAWLRRGRIYPSAESPPLEGGLLIQDGRVLGLGRDEDLASAAPRGASRIDLAGRTVLPGLVDAHLHLEQYALSADLVDCETSTLDECLVRVRARAARVPPGEWIRGHGWNQNSWGRFGDRNDLDRAAPSHPVYLTAKSLHAGWANSAALRLASLGATDADPPDGTIVRGEDGAPTGILLEGAMSMLTRAIPAPRPSQVAPLILQAQERLWRLGLVGVHDFDGSRCFQALQLLHEDGRLGLRVIKNLPAADLGAASHLGLRSGFGDEWLRLGHVKVFADGALGPRTAAMIEPYEDDPGNTGMALLDDEELLEKAIRAGEAGWPMAVHAIGDRANHLVLDAFTELRRQEASRAWPARRHRVEHLQLLHPDDRARPAQLGLVASMQPVHAVSDMPMAQRAWGKRSRYAYAWRGQRGSGARLAFGSDAPVESPNPFWGLHAAVTRRRPDGSPGPDGWIPEERLSMAEALAGFTEGPAFAAGLEDKTGRLAPGLWADLIVLEADPLLADPDSVRDLLPCGVMTGGVWRLRDF